MKVLVVHGSPQKKGSSSTIASAYATEAEKLGAKVTHYHLNTMDYNGCQGCMVCKTKQEDCAVKDDLTAVLEAHHEADIVVWASPIYYFDVTGQFKNFIDRTYSFLKPDWETNPDISRLPHGKKGLIILSQGAAYHHHYDVAARYNLFMESHAIMDKKTIRAAQMYAPEKEKLQPYIEQAESYAKEMIG